jgi:hypothetical protein
MADKRISQLVDRGTVANNDVVPIVVSGAVTTNKATISSIQTFMQGNLDLGVTSVGITFGTSGTDINASGSPVTSSGNITINLPTASATNRGALSSADWITFNSKQPAGNYVTLDTVQTITAQKTFTGSGSSDTVIISHGSGSGFGLDVIKAGNNEAIRVQKTSGSGNAMTISGGNFEAPTIVKTGGTSSQFLMADGSVNTSVLPSGAYLPLAGGTLTGTLNGTSANFTNNVTIDRSLSSLGNALTLTKGSDADQAWLAFQQGAAADGVWRLGYTGDPYDFRINVGTNASIGSQALRIFETTQNVKIGTGSNDDGFKLDVVGSGRFSSSVTASSLIRSGGTSSEFLKADGSVDSNTYLTSASASSTFVTLSTSQTITGEKTFNTSGVLSAIFNSSFATGGVISFLRGAVGVGNIGNSGSLGVGILDDFEMRAATTRGLHLKTDGGRLSLSVGGVVTLDGALNGTSASFSSSVTALSLVGSESFNGLINAVSTRNSSSGTSARNRFRFGNDSSANTFTIDVFGSNHTGESNNVNLSIQTSTGSLIFGTNGTERTRINSGGFFKASNTGVYSSSTGLYHEFRSDREDNLAYFFNTSANPYGPYFRFPNAAPNNAVNYFMYCDDNGASPRFSVRSNGGIANYAANNVILSDERVKKDIEPLESYWDKFKEIEIVKYKYKDQTHDDFNIGVIAQQVEKVAPEFVDMDGWGKPELDEEGNEIVSEEEPLKSVYDSDLHHATIKVLQEAMSKIEELQEQIDSLKNHMQ